MPGMASSKKLPKTARAQKSASAHCHANVSLPTPFLNILYSIYTNYNHVDRVTSAPSGRIRRLGRTVYSCAMQAAHCEPRRPAAYQPQLSGEPF